MSEPVYRSRPGADAMRPASADEALTMAERTVAAETP